MKGPHLDPANGVGAWGAASGPKEGDNDVKNMLEEAIGALQGSLALMGNDQPRLALGAHVAPIRVLSLGGGALLGRPSSIDPAS